MRPRAQSPNRLTAWNSRRYEAAGAPADEDGLRATPARNPSTAITAHHHHIINPSQQHSSINSINNTRAATAAATSSTSSSGSRGRRRQKNQGSRDRARLARRHRQEGPGGQGEGVEGHPASPHHVTGGEREARAAPQPIPSCGGANALQQGRRKAIERKQVKKKKKTHQECKKSRKLAYDE